MTMFEIHMIIQSVCVVIAFIAIEMELAEVKRNVMELMKRKGR